MKEYILSICITSVICAIIASFCSKGSYSSVIKMICGAFLCVTVIAPLKQLDPQDLSNGIDHIHLDSERISGEGRQIASQAISDNISDQAQAYILDKAASYGASITVEIIMDQDDPRIPSSAVIRGTVSPFCKAQLQRLMEEDIGIKRENQLWK